MTQTDRGLAVQAEQPVAVVVVQRGVEVGVVQLLAVQALVQVHRVRGDQPGLQRRILVDLQRGDIQVLPGCGRRRASMARLAAFAACGSLRI